MDQEPQDQNQEAKANSSSNDGVNLDNILLPTKEIHSIDSAQRVDAGTLLQQEQSATLSPVEAPHVSPPPAPRPHGGNVRPLQTFQGDIAGAIQNKGVSVVSIAAAEANRRGTQPVSQDAQLTARPESHALRNIFFIALGVLLVGGAIAIVIYSVLKNAPLPQQQTGSGVFIAIDTTQKLSVSPEIKGSALMQQLTAAKNSVSLSLGLVAQLYIEETATTTDGTLAYMDAQALFSKLAPGAPQTLVRDIEPVYLLGVHSFDANHAFLILKVDSYEQAYAGMLLWEKTMLRDLSPLFTYVPPIRINPVPSEIPVELLGTSTAATSTTATSTSLTASSTTPVATTTSATSTIPTAQAGFIDAIVDNHDARVLTDAYGTIDFLWTFLDRQTLVITTNPNTLHELITRLKKAPLTSQPNSQ